MGGSWSVFLRQGEAAARHPDELEGSQAPSAECWLGELPDSLVAQLWPPERVLEGLCVCSKDLTRALLGAPGIRLAFEKSWKMEQADACVAWAKVFDETLRRMPNLVEVRLGSHKDNAMGAEALAGALSFTTGLQVLSIVKCGLQDRGAVILAEALRQLSGLRELALEANHSGDEGAGALAGALSLMTGLRALSLADNAIRSRGAVELGGCLPTSLRRLSLRGNTLGFSGVVALLGPRLRGLLDLDLGNVGMYCSKAQAVALGEDREDSLPPRLVHLNLENNLLPYWLPQAIARGFFPTTLESLNLRQSLLGLPQTLAGHLPPNLLHGLRYLDVGFNKFTAERVTVFAQCLPPTLQHFVLDWNPLFAGESGLLEAAEALGLALPRDLQRLSLVCCGLNLATAEALARHLPPRLRRLDLGSNRLRGGGLAGFVRALPATLQHLDLSNIRLTTPEALALVPFIPHGLRCLGLENNAFALKDSGVLASVKDAERVRGAFRAQHPRLNLILE